MNPLTRIPWIHYALFLLVPSLALFALAYASNDCFQYRSLPGIIDIAVSPSDGDPSFSEGDIITELDRHIGINHYQCVDDLLVVSVGHHIEIHRIGLGGKFERLSSLFIRMSNYDIEGDYLYGMSSTSIIVCDISDPYHPVVLASTPYTGIATNDIMALHGILYCAVGNGLTIIDATDPYRPSEISHTYQASYSTHIDIVQTTAFVSCQGVGLRLYDVSDPAYPISNGYIPTRGTTIRTHRINDLLYVLNQSTTMEFIDVSDVLNPVHHDGPTLLSPITSVVDHHGMIIATDSDGAIIELAMNGIYPIGIARTTMNHGGMADLATSAHLLASTPVGIATIALRDWSRLTTPDVFDTNQYMNKLTVSDRHAVYVYSHDHIQVIRINNYGQMSYAGSLEMDSPVQSLAFVRDDILLVGCMNALVSVSISPYLTVVQRIDTEGSVYSITSDGSIAHYRLGTQIITAAVSQDGILTELNRWDASVYGQVEASNGFMCIFSDHILKTIDISDPAGPALIGEVAVPSEINGLILIHDEYLYMLDRYGSELLTYQLDRTAPPTLIHNTHLRQSISPAFFAISGSYMYISSHFGGIDVYDILDFGRLMHIANLGLNYIPQTLGVTSSRIITYKYPELHSYPQQCEVDPLECEWDTTPFFPRSSRATAWSRVMNDDGSRSVLIASSPAVLRTSSAQGHFYDDPYLLPEDARSGSWGDPDNDGDEDLALIRAEHRWSLLVKDDETFTTMLMNEVLPTSSPTTPTWVDYDLDGYVDLYCVDPSGPNILLHNTGDLQFERIMSTPANDLGEGRSVAIADFDDDGDQDIYVVNRGPNVLLRNDVGSFVDVTTPVLGDAGEGKAACWGDADNDGDLDLYLVNQRGRNRYYRNTAGVLTDATTDLLGDSGDGRDATWVDIDNDGDLDLVIANTGSDPVILLNFGNGSFYESECRYFYHTLRPSSLAPIDIDLDGDLDMVLSSPYVESAIIKNNDWHKHHWSRINLVGTDSNRDAMGARVRLFSGGVWRIREMSDGSGHLSHAPHELHFGLGYASWIDTLVVQWPSGREDSHLGLPTDMPLTILEGQATPIIATDHSATFHDGVIEIRWSLARSAPGTSFMIERYDNDSGWFIPISTDAEYDGQAWCWVDSTIDQGATYRYRVSLSTPGGESDLFTSETVRIPTVSTSLISCVPNPFNPSTTIRYNIGIPDRVRIAVYALDGSMVAELLNEDRPAGVHEIVWKGCDRLGRNVASGNYLVRISTQENSDTERVTLLQ